jgi:hypothetical protein
VVTLAAKPDEVPLCGWRKAKEATPPPGRKLMVGWSVIMAETERRG